MTHTPPIPPGNQSPYPVIMPPQVTATVRSDAPASLARKGEGRNLLSTLIVGGVVAGAIAGIATAITSRRKADPKTTTSTPKRRKAPAKPASKPRAKPNAARLGLTSGSDTGRKRDTAPAGRTSAATKRTRRASSATAKGGAQDRSLIAMTQDHEVQYWTHKFGVDRATLQSAVDAVGHSAAAVQAELAKA